MIQISKKDHIWSYIGTILNYGINLILLPLILKMLPMKDLGLWYTFASIQSLVMIFDFGFSTTLRRNLTYAWCGAQTLDNEGIHNGIFDNKPNFRLFTSVYLSCRVICLIVALVASFVMITIGTVYIHYVTSPFGNYSKYLVIWFIYILGVFFNFYFSYLTNVLTGIGAIAQRQIATITAKIFQLIAVLVGFLMQGGLLSLIIAYLLSGFVFRIVAIYYLNNYKNVGNEIRINKPLIDKKDRYKIFRTVWFNAKRAGISSIATSAKAQSGTLICSGLFGIETTAMYGLCLQLISIITTIAQINFQTNIPIMAENRLSGDILRLKKVYSSSMTLYYVLFVFGMFALVFFGMPLIQYIKPDIILPINLLLFLGLASILEQSWSLGAGFIATGNKLPHVRSVVITSLCEILLSFLLALYSKWGVYALVLSQLIAEGCYVDWKWPITALKEINMSFTEMAKIGLAELQTEIRHIMRRK